MNAEILAKELQRLRSGLLAIEARWREASQDRCFTRHYRDTIAECAAELRSLLDGVDDSEMQAEIEKAFEAGEL